ncbi:1,4-beta-xylanase [Glaciihabitans arcticus]|uniref:Beta-xylanase n=1 Tax=Glaciihabitans arcticus TaxID=2668039 RepID=A0A4Q9GTB1_9MICO|nr:endo-1,4-beta-xylanase [Glaciihabitans arcticus]TBN55460.1 1,4-beta-xylanase [Glaciihabitans arcticus]
MTVVTQFDTSVRHRLGQAVVTVCDASGQPLPDRTVHLEQKRHAFAFGNIGFDFLDLASRDDDLGPSTSPAFGRPSADLEGLADLWLDLFNTATLPFYWSGFEPRPGHTDTRRLLRSARWFADRGVRLKGHPLVWHTLSPDWLLELSLDEVELAQRLRVRREVSDFAGLIDTWDAINEAVIMPVFDRQANAITALSRDVGRIPMIRLAVEEARAANPAATLLINDFDLSSAYEVLIEAVLEAAIPIDGIGLQTHMHQGYRGEDAIAEILERFARYELPLHLTETTLLSGDLMPPGIEDLNDYHVDSWPSTEAGEERQAEEMVRHYRSLLAHPAVASVTYWGFTDAGAWLGAPVGLVRADGTPKPSYEAMRSLLKDEWWLGPTTLRTDRLGRVAVEAFAGDFEVRVRGRVVDVQLRAGETSSIDIMIEG